PAGAALVCVTRERAIGFGAADGGTRLRLVVDVLMKVGRLACRHDLLSVPPRGQVPNQFRVNATERVRHSTTAPLVGACAGATGPGGTMTSMTGQPDHYFTAAPASAEERRPVRMRLAGRDVEVQVAGGVFSPGGVDKGTAVLLDEVPDPPEEGVFLDLGCGWGPIALTLGLLRPRADVWAVDVNERALDLTRTNAAALGLDRIHVALPEQVPDDTRYDL